MSRAVSIQRDLAVRLVLLTLLVSVTAGAALYLYIRATLWGQFDTSLAAKARALASVAKLEVRDGGAARLEFDFPEATMPEFSRARHPEYFELVRDDGSYVARSTSLKEQPALVSDPRSDRPMAFYDLRLPNGRRGRGVRFVFFALVDDEENGSKPGHLSPPAPRLMLTFARESHEIEETLDTLLTSLLCAAAGMGIVTGGGVYWTVRRGLRPLRDVADTAARIDIDSLADRFPITEMPVELRPICERLNDLLARLEDSFRRERRFSADVAHELRTPIAELRSMAEVALKWPGDAASVTKNSEDTFAIARQMERMVTALLSLARCQAGRQAIDRQSVNLSELLREAWRPCERLAEKRSLTAVFKCDTVESLHTDRAMMMSVLSNLLENAATYATAGGRIEVLARRENDAVEILIGNSNDSLTAADLQHLSEAFWRKDAARTSGEHSGLGLPLVHAFSTVLGEPVRFALREPDWFQATLRLPV